MRGGLRCEIFLKTMSSPTKNTEIHTQLAVLGAGPGGYTAAFRAADLGMKVTLIERYPSLGGVCLNVGCIPSKALLHAAHAITAAAHARDIGVQFGKPKVDLGQMRQWKAGIISQLTQGLAGLSKKRKVEVVQGSGRFISPQAIEVSSAADDSGTNTTIHFEQAIIATGSAPIKIPNFPHDDARVMDSTDALQLDEVPKSLLVVGGGIIGLEMATVYHALGSCISVVEWLDSLMAGADPDLLRPLTKRISQQYENIWTKTRVTEMKPLKSGIQVGFESANQKNLPPKNMTFDKVLVCVGRTPNAHSLQSEAAGIAITEHGFIEVDIQQRTNIPHIFAIGDIVGQPMLAHKATHQGKVAAEVASGMKSAFESRAIPSVAYTDPEVAWVGITEAEAKQKGIAYGKGVFPWAASGRALSQSRSDGVTKLLFDSDERVIGAGITGSNAGDLIAEAALAIEMNADAEDIGLTIHAHPTLAETLGLAAETFSGVITDLYAPKAKVK